MGKTKIMVVEDEALFSMALRSHVERLGYDTYDYIGSGEKAIEIAKEEHPDLVIMDILLAGRLNGIETAEAIRSQKDIPIVFLTGGMEPELLEEIERIGSSFFLTKPTSPDEVEAIIIRALS